MRIDGESVEAPLHEALYLDSIRQPWPKTEGLWVSIRQGMDRWRENLESLEVEPLDGPEQGDVSVFNRPVKFTLSLSQQKLLKFMIQAEVSKDEALARGVEGDVDMSLVGLVMERSTPQLMSDQIVHLRRAFVGRSLLNALEARDKSDLLPN